MEFISDDAAALSRSLPFAELIFARQKLLRLADLRGVDPTDRIAPIIAALSTGSGLPYGELWVEHPDSDEGKPLAGLARSFGNALRPALRKTGKLTRQDDARRPRLHVVFLAGDQWGLILPNIGIMLVFGLVFFTLSFRVTRRSLD